MKNAFVFGLLAFVAAASAFAANSVPVIEKWSGGGFVPLEHRRFEHCQVFVDKVVIERGFAGVQTREERNVQISGDLAAMIQRASQEAVEEQPGMICDAPSTSVTARLTLERTEDDVTLFISGGCGSARRERTGAASRALRNLIDEYCPTTHDLGHGN